ncbi:hypothetical protein NQ315_014543 [Exocentrus adspersus]|uniref:Uncharacterized protein n=1 Tax=Exocentrus adspersus TaxID=1586481 RepID=A0AAV8VL24_9CUCU|nr:hypothetical protein NQ315_014543 [Exocentrus adspersus]
MECLGSILKDYAFNIKKTGGADYKESVIKTMWNIITSKKLQQHYYDNFNIIFDPFKDVHFQQARKARDTKRGLLQKDPTKRNQSSTAFTPNEYHTITNSFDEDTPAGVQQKFSSSKISMERWRSRDLHDREEFSITQLLLRQPKVAQKKLADSKWLVQNKINNANTE